MEKIKKEEEFKEMGEVKKKPNISNNSKKIVKEIKNVSSEMNKLNVEKIIDKGKKIDKQITFYQKYKFPVGDYLEAKRLLNQRDEELKNIPVKRLLDDDFDRKYNYNNNIQNINNLQNINQNISNYPNNNINNPNISNNNINIQSHNISNQNLQNQSINHSHISNQNLQNQSINQTQNISNQNLQNQSINQTQNISNQNLQNQSLLNQSYNSNQNLQNQNISNNQINKNINQSRIIQNKPINEPISYPSYPNPLPNYYEEYPQQSLRIQKNFDNYPEPTQIRNISNCYNYNNNSNYCNDNYNNYNNYCNDNYKNYYNNNNNYNNYCNDNYNNNYQNCFQNNNCNQINNYNTNLYNQKQQINNQQNDNNDNKIIPQEIDIENERRIIQHNKNVSNQIYKQIEDTQNRVMEMQNKIINNSLNSNYLLSNDPFNKYRKENNNRMKDLEKMTNYIQTLYENKDSLEKNLEKSNIKNELDSAKNNLEHLNDKLKNNEHRRKILMNNYTYECNNENDNNNIYINNNLNDIYCLNRDSLKRNNSYNNCLSSMNKYNYPERLTKFDFQRKI